MGKARDHSSRHVRGDHCDSTLLSSPHDLAASRRELLPFGSQRVDLKGRSILHGHRPQLLFCPPTVARECGPEILSTICRVPLNLAVRTHSHRTPPALRSLLVRSLNEHRMPHGRTNAGSGIPCRDIPLRSPRDLDPPHPRRSIFQRQIGTRTTRRRHRAVVNQKVRTRPLLCTPSRENARWQQPLGASRQSRALPTMSNRVVIRTGRMSPYLSNMSTTIKHRTNSEEKIGRQFKTSD